MKRPSEPTEHAEQCVVMTWAALNAGKWPCLRMLYAVPNGAFFGGEVKQLKSGKSVPVGAIRARKLKAEGLKEGVPDLCLPVPAGKTGRGGAFETVSHGIYIELKRRTLGKPSAMQQWWRQCLILMGYRAELCHGAAAAIEMLREHVMHAPKTVLPPMPESKKTLRRGDSEKKSKKRTRVSAPLSKPRPFLIPPRYG